MLKPIIQCPLVVVVCGIMILLQSFADNPVKQQDDEEEGYGILSSMPAIWYHASTGRSFILSSMSRPATLIPTIIIIPCLWVFREVVGFGNWLQMQCTLYLSIKWFKTILLQIFAK